MINTAQIIQLNPNTPLKTAKSPETAILTSVWEGIGQRLANDLTARQQAENAKNAASQAACLTQIAKILTDKRALNDIQTIAGNDIDKFARGIDGLLAHYQSGKAVNTVDLLKACAKNSGIPEDFLRKKIKPLLESHNILIKNQDNTFQWADLKQLKQGASMLKKLHITYTLPTHSVHTAANQVLISRAKEPATWAGLALIAASSYGLNAVNNTAAIASLIEQFGYAPHVTLLSFAAAGIKHGLNSLSKRQLLLLSASCIPSIALFGASGHAQNAVAVNMANAISQTIGSHSGTIISLSATIALLLYAADAMPNLVRLADIIGHWATTGKYLRANNTKVNIAMLVGENQLSPVSDAERNNITSTLSNYGLNVRGVQGKHDGLVVARYMLAINAGVKLGALPLNDIARDLGVNNVSVETNAGKGLIGLDVPQPQRQWVKLSDLLSSSAWQQRDPALRLPCCPAVDQFGNPVIFDLDQTPHLIIAGTTGSGKSVFAKAILFSLMSSGADFRLMIADGKTEDFAKPLSQSKHLLQDADVLSVATEVDDIKAQVQFLADEMDNRLKTGNKPYPVIFLCDELADIVMQDDKQQTITKCLARLAQKARSARIHMILITQYPTNEVIPNIINANTPSRIGLLVDKGHQSRVIIGEEGCEKLQGKGDCLLKIAGEKIRRVHGATIDNQQQFLN